jgi:two-component system response regulator FixJ
MADSGRLVHLIDDDEAIRRSVSFMLRTSDYLVKTYASGVEFLDALATISPGCIVLDVRMPEIDGLEVQARLKELGILLPVVVMTGHGDVGLAVQAMKAGAIDFIEKPFEQATLLAALEQALDQLRQSGQQTVRRDQAQARLQALTPREAEVLQGLVRGHPNKTIAYDLGISPRTVEIHRANVMTKLDVRSLSDALRIAFTAGLGSEPEG